MIAAHETGMRAGEIFHLSWDQVDLGKGMIILHPENTKTNEGRKVPISPRLMNVLRRLPRGKGKVAPSVFMYHGRKIISVKHAFTTACKRAGIEGFVFHDFRHTFVTNMRRAGVQDRVIMAITGHKTLSVFMGYDTVDEQDL